MSRFLPSALFVHYIKFLVVLLCFSAAGTGIVHFIDNSFDWFLLFKLCAGSAVIITIFMFLVKIIERRS